MLTIIGAIAAMTVAQPSSDIEIDQQWTTAGEWNPMFDALTCMLARDYVDGDGKPARVIWRPDPVGESVEIMIEREGKKRFRDSDAGRLLRSGEGKLFDASSQYFNMASDRNILFISTRSTPLVRLSEEQVEQLKALKEGESMEIDETTLFDEEFAVRLDQGKWASIPTPGLERAAGALEACRDGLKMRLGVPLDHEDDRIKPAVMEEHGFSAADYPSKMLRVAAQGRPGMFFWVAEDGRVDECHVIETSGHAEFDKQLCKKFKLRARFSPAETKDGEPMRDAQFQRLVFRLP